MESVCRQCLFHYCTFSLSSTRLEPTHLWNWKSWLILHAVVVLSARQRLQFFSELQMNRPLHARNDTTKNQHFTFNNDDGVRKADFIWYCEYHLKCNVLIKIFNLLVIFSFAVVWGMSNKGFWRCSWGLRFASMVSMVVTLFRISMLRSLFSLCWQWLIIPEGDKIKPFFLQF